MEAVYRCARCGAPLPVTPETIVSICEYCGYPNPIQGVVSEDDVYVLPAISQDSALREFWRIVKSDFDLRRLAREIDVFNVRGVYVPVWLGEVRVRGKISYYRRKVEDDKVKYVFYVDEVDDVMIVPLVARRQVAAIGVSEALNSLSKDVIDRSVKLKDVPVGEWETIRLDVLNTEFDKRAASLRIREDAIDILRGKYRRKADGIDAMVVEASEPRGLKLLLLPIWQVYYRCRGSIYQVFLAGWSGYVLVKTEPVTPFRRALYVAGTLISILASSLIGAFVLASKEVKLGQILFLILPLTISYYLSSRIVAGVRVER